MKLPKSVTLLKKTVKNGLKVHCLHVRGLHCQDQTVVTRACAKLENKKTARC